MNTPFRSRPLQYAILLAIFGMMACNSNPQQQQEQEAEPATQEVSLIPEGFQVMATDTLTTEGQTFVINVLQQVDEDSLRGNFQEVLRPLIILEKTGETDYSMVARNDEVILCAACGGMMGDPWDGLYLEEGGFSVNYTGGSSDRWTRTIIFKYDLTQKAWFLTSDRGASYSSLDPEGTFESNIYTPGDSLGTVPFEDFKTEF